MNLLTTNQVKMLKSEGKGYLSAILNMAPAYRYGRENTCPNAGKCKATCLQNTGRNRFDIAAAARIRRTRQYYDNRAAFYALLCADLDALQRKAAREGVLATCRLNGLSDIPFELDKPDGERTIFEMYPEIQFIDYTKSPDRALDATLPGNYHLTYSYSEKTPTGLLRSIYADTNFNAAAVFLGELPESYIIHGQEFRVISGDGDDLRHLDPRFDAAGMPILIGLRYKLPFKNGKAMRPKANGFLLQGQE